MKGNNIFLFYGEGGHKEEMESLLMRFSEKRNDINFIGFAEGKAVIRKIKNYNIIPMRSKYSRLTMIYYIPCAFLYNNFIVLLMIIRYRPKGIISTGPGSILFPAILCRMLNIKIIYIENGSRFMTKSFSGKYMYYIADKFYIQNSDLQNLYPKAIYAGLL